MRGKTERLSESNACIDDPPTALGLIEPSLGHGGPERGLADVGAGLGLEGSEDVTSGNRSARPADQRLASPGLHLLDHGRRRGPG